MEPRVSVLTLGVADLARAGLGVVAASLTIGFAVPVLTLPAADHLQDRVSAHVGVDER